jgi:hypothetical protein
MRHWKVGMLLPNLHADFTGEHPLVEEILANYWYWASLARMAPFFFSSAVIWMLRFMLPYERECYRSLV